MPIVVTLSSSTTVQNIIDRALRLLGQIQSGTSGDSNETADGMTALNALLGRWDNEGLMCFARQDESFSLTSGTSSYTIGPSGTWVTTRPIAIEGAWVVASNITYPMRPIDNEQYDGILYKVASSNWPDRFNYTPTYPNGTVVVYPVPNGTYTIHFRTRVQLSSFLNSSDTISLPPGWEDALAFNLAVVLAPEFNREATPTVIAMARSTKRVLERANSQRIKADNELAAIFAKRRSRIISDT